MSKIFPQAGLRLAHKRFPGVTRDNQLKRTDVVGPGRHAPNISLTAPAIPT